MFGRFKRYKEKVGTSLSDNMSYPDFCQLASEDEAVFENFKANRIYNGILEHVSYELGKEYLQIAKRQSAPGFVEENLLGFQRNEFYGGGVKFYYSELQNFLSPTTLRYIKVLTDLDKLFGLDNLGKVAEIGVGYGGQCRIIKSIKPELDYTLVDLPQVCNLSRRYLSNYSLDNIHFVDGTSEFEPIKADFCMSNYAYSELKREIQEGYFEKIIRNCSKGYITWNWMSEEILDGYTAKQFIKKLPGAHIIEEEPLTANGNCIVVWGDR